MRSRQQERRGSERFGAVPGSRCERRCAGLMSDSQWRTAELQSSFSWHLSPFLEASCDCLHSLMRNPQRFGVTRQAERLANLLAIQTSIEAVRSASPFKQRSSWASLSLDNIERSQYR